MPSKSGIRSKQMEGNIQMLFIDSFIEIVKQSSHKYAQCGGTELWIVETAIPNSESGHANKAFTCDPENYWCLLHATQHIN